MRITLRLILALVFTSSIVVLSFAGIQYRQEEWRLEQELDKKAGMLAESLQVTVEPLIQVQDRAALSALVNRFESRDHLKGIGLFDLSGQPLTLTPLLTPLFPEAPSIAYEALENDKEQSTFFRNRGTRWHLYAIPIHRPGDSQGEPVGVLVLFHEAGYVDQQISQIWKENVARLLWHILLISLTTLLIIRWMLIRPLLKTVEWIKRIRIGEETDHTQLPREGLFAPLAREVSHMAKSLTAARTAAEEEARLRLQGQTLWTPERLKEQVRDVLAGQPMIVIANREPYTHVRQGRQIQCLMPPSGLVTGVEPILRACGGTWIAHGSGDADREMVDSQGRLRVPPESPAYTLRRVWLTPEEEAGYYYGFSNEGLWPLCHIAHTRPIFRAEDWNQYQRVNEKFAQAALAELEATENPFILIQDYHFALLPRMIKSMRPDAKIALFWHIPWPNPEAFAICPWARQLLHGMLGADLLGFHIQFHGNNFLDTVDRLLESRIDWEQFAVNRAGHTTWIKPFPISVEFPAENPQDPFGKTLTASTLRETLFKNHGIQAQWMGVGVDRLDYTKGIGERFRAIELFLEKHPEFQGKFTFVELGAPSRSALKRYQDLETELEATVEEINQRFQTRNWKPILLLKKHHSHAEILPFYRAANVCLVSSLHDGMNLVAKEFVAARSDEQGVLILSRFAGASRELRDAFLVNPYDVDQVSDAIYYALTIDAEDERSRMLRMRDTVRKNNVYRWAANLVTELAQVPTVHARKPSSVAEPKPT